MTAVHASDIVELSVNDFTFNSFIVLRRNDPISKLLFLTVYLFILILGKLTASYRDKVLI